MSGPKHLWSGDWEDDSSAARDALARRRQERPVEEEPAPARPEPPRAPRAPSLGGVVGWARRTQVGVIVIVIAVLLTAAAGYGLTSLVAGSGGGSPGQGPRAWLGVDVTGTPLGIMVANVAPGSPAALAGLQPGDQLTEIAHQPIGTVDAVTAALKELNPGQTVPITFSRGLISYTTQATLAKAPSGSP